MTAHIDCSRDFSVEGSGFPVAVTLEVHPGWGRTWLARLSPPLTEEDRKFGVAREFLEREGQKVSRRGNGDVYYELLEPGTYEASSVYRSYRTFRAVFRVEADGTVELLGTDVEDNLRKIYRSLTE